MRAAGAFTIRRLLLSRLGVWQGLWGFNRTAMPGELRLGAGEGLRGRNCPAKRGITLAVYREAV